MTHTLDVGAARLPMIVREIDGSAGLCDAISPYGYPGGSPMGGGEPVRATEIDWSDTGLVSLFVRDRVGATPAFSGGTERSQVQIHDPAQESGVRPRLAEQIRQNERAGWGVDVVPGPGVSDHQRAAFLSLYIETMTRTEAAPRYFYGAEYFASILSSPRSWLLLASSERADVGAGAIAGLSDGVLHYYLGGTGDDFLEGSPFKNVVAAMMELAGEVNAPLNLGGGVRPGDGLERFKRGFANAQEPFVTHEIVCDRDAYERLAPAHDVSGFFPAYRAS